MNDDNTTPDEVAEDTVAEAAADSDFVAEETAGDAEESPETDQVADAAWRDVIGQLDGLAEAAGRWTRAAIDDPANRQRAKELRDHMEQMATDVGDTIDGAIDDAKAADVSKSFKDAASKTGDAFKTAGSAFSNEVAPRMATAFRGAAEGMNRAAEKMERPAPPPPPPGDTPVEPEAPGTEVNEEPPPAADDSSE